MALVLKQVRICDGKCCAESPRWPNKVGSHCIFWDQGCKLMRGESSIPNESPLFPGRPGDEVFMETCVGWPQNSPQGRGTGGCCWQWVGDGN